MYKSIAFFVIQADDISFASQLQVYQDIGVEMLDHAFEGWVKIKASRGKFAARKLTSWKFRGFGF